ncbi:Rod shape-determining protein MreD [Roseivirga sp. BDSF3-8]|uniref:Rod shape-determining protein MreD n=1 Tax=Roseivirga sp. BDSF3-8 TaxID=3241598 RepID=UPI003532201B
MNGARLIGHLLAFAAYLLLQVLIFRNVVLFDTAFCFIYIGALLMLPFDIGRLPAMLLGFICGLVVDIFYDSLGIHAAASVFMMYLRPYWINLITPRGGYENVSTPRLKLLGSQWFATYAIALSFVHHLILFYVEVGSFHLFFFTLSKVVASTLLTFTMLVVFQYLFYSSRRSVI